MLSVANLKLPTGQHINLEIKAGEIHCLRGDSGVGKTRLLRALADLDECSGAISLNGQDCKLTPAPEWRSKVMLVPARPRWWLATAGEHMARDMQHKARQLRLQDKHLASPTDRLSSGEGSRLALLRALSYQPAVLLLDEPTAALDEEAEAAMEQLLQEYVADKQHCILWVTHSRSQAERVSDIRWLLTQATLEHQP